MMGRSRPGHLTGFLTSDHGRPDPETIALWWVKLNCWEWPDDMPGKPNPPGGMTPEQERFAIRGAHIVLDMFADEDLIQAAWDRHQYDAAGKVVV